MKTKITVTGVAEIGDKSKEPITDLETLAKLDGVEYRGDTLTKYLAGSERQEIKSALDPGGEITLRFDKETGGVLYVTEYASNRELTDSELDELLRFTAAQWSDGVGSGFNDHCWQSFDTWVEYSGGSRNANITQSTPGKS